MSSSEVSTMDGIQTPLNPCSLETIQEPLQLDEGKFVWPLVVCCYHLDETIGHRRGQLDLFHVAVPNIQSDSPSLPLKFGRPTTLLEPSMTSGILDGKWSHARGHLFATAHASGEIKIHQLRRVRDAATVSKHCYTLEFQSQSEKPALEGSIPPLCLSLNFSCKANHHVQDLPESLPIVSTYSNGRVAVHDIMFLESGGISIIERESWEAHNMFINPAEVWSADFCGPQSVLSCGDEGKMKLWDVRATNRPMHVLSPFDAGATCASAHPVHDYLVACGSYDETICLYDIRFLSTKAPVSRSKKLGGGIWRIKWHPYVDQRMLVAAMHGGCRVVEVENWGSVGVPYTAEEFEGGTQFSFQVTKKFTEHDSMAYGADWLVCKHPTRNGFFEAAGSCSFYDRNVFLWDTL